MNENYNKIEVFWNTHGAPVENFNLPTIVDVPIDIEEEDILDWLSDEYDFCVESWRYYWYG